MVRSTRSLLQIEELKISAEGQPFVEDIETYAQDIVDTVRRAMRRILLVEDNEMNRDMLSRRLQRRGYEVIIALDGQQGVQMAQSRSPDVVLMDMSLPVMDGWEATRTLKSSPETRNIPVIALTAHAMSTDRERAMEAGCDDYDTKPIELTRLIAKIESLIARFTSDTADAGAGS